MPSSSFSSYPSSSSVQLHHYEDSDTFKCVLGYFGVSVIHRILTWTMGSLTCVRDLFACVYSKKTWCLTSTETIRLIREGGGGGMEVGEEGDYIRMISALRWAAKRAILMFR